MEQIVIQENDLELKKQELVDRVYASLSTKKSSEETDGFFREKCERIVAEHKEQIEKIFKSTESFYEASDIYKKSNEEKKLSHGLEDDYTLPSGTSIKENKQKFHTSIECQQNASKAKILEITASGHEFSMLLPLDGLEFLRSVGITDEEDLENVKSEISDKLFKAKFYGFLSKIEAKTRLTKQAFLAEISKLLLSSEKESSDE